MRNPAREGPRERQLRNVRASLVYQYPRERSLQTDLLMVSYPPEYWVHCNNCELPHPTRKTRINDSAQENSIPPDRPSHGGRHDAPKDLFWRDLSSDSIGRARGHAAPDQSPVRRGHFGMADLRGRPRQHALPSV